MPEGLSFTDQASPSACLLPVAQSCLRQMVLFMNEDRHDITLMRMGRVTAKQRSSFGELKQKSSIAESGRAIVCCVIGRDVHRNNGERQFRAFPFA